MFVLPVMIRLSNTSYLKFRNKHAAAWGTYLQFASTQLAWWS